MKQYILVFLTLAVCISFCGCNRNDSACDSIKKPSEAEVETVATGVSLPDDPTEAPTVETGNEETQTDNTEPIHTQIVLTPENWDTYFELVTIATWSENAFGETTKLYLDNYYKLKDEYANICASETTIAVEYSQIMSEKKCTIDFQARTYTIHDEFIWGPFESTELQTYIGYSENVGGYCMSLGWNRGGTSVGENAVAYYYDFKVIRVQGTLCLLDVE